MGSHDRRSLQLFKSCKSLQPFERTNVRQKDELDEAFFFFFFFWGGGGGGGVVICLLEW